MDRSQPFSDDVAETSVLRFFDDIDAPARLEGSGIALANVSLQKSYIATRELLVRPSCRDERRIVAALFANGPSSPAELAMAALTRAINCKSENSEFSRNTTARTLRMISETRFKRGCPQPWVGEVIDERPAA